MSDLALPDPAEPLDLYLAPCPAPSGVHGVVASRFEFSSRGDRVPGRLLLPEGAARPCPLVLLQHGAGGAKDAPYLDAAAGPWVRGGAAVASIDFPLHGERASAKLTERALGYLAGAGAGHASESEALFLELARQAVLDLHRAVDALGRVPDVDASRLAYVGFSMGAILGAAFCAADRRVGAAVLAIGGGGFGPREIDPVHHVARIAPRPILFVNAERDERIPRAAAEALHAAAGDPKETLWFDATHAALPGIALKAMWAFLRRELALA